MSWLVESIMYFKCKKLTGFFFLPPHSDQLTQLLVIWELVTIFTEGKWLEHYAGHYI